MFLGESEQDLKIRCEHVPLGRNNSKESLQLWRDLESQLLIIKSSQRTHQCTHWSTILGMACFARLLLINLTTQIADTNFQVYVNIYHSHSHAIFWKKMMQRIMTDAYPIDPLNWTCFFIVTIRQMKGRAIRAFQLSDVLHLIVVVSDANI